MRWKATPGLRRPNERTERPPSQRERGHRAGSGTARSGGALGDTVSLLGLFIAGRWTRSEDDGEEILRAGAPGMRDGYCGAWRHPLLQPSSPGTPLGRHVEVAGSRKMVSCCTQRRVGVLKDGHHSRDGVLATVEDSEGGRRGTMPSLVSSPFQLKKFFRENWARAVGWHTSGDQMGYGRHRWEAAIVLLSGLAGSSWRACLRCLVSCGMMGCCTYSVAHRRTSSRFRMMICGKAFEAEKGSCCASPSQSRLRHPLTRSGPTAAMSSTGRTRTEPSIYYLPVKPMDEDLVLNLRSLLHGVDDVACSALVFCQQAFMEWRNARRGGNYPSTRKVWGSSISLMSRNSRGGGKMLRRHGSRTVVPKLQETSNIHKLEQ
ncbi:hypothetical protein MLD38_018748 [Melastoma candidum]|uniref:Uncharacterized protein n=1 Tax=Melastoma candidum TaxID=119954 RepID=A0ACB9QUQ5_9MYRT|nr:hypothetical protein MLD38_018748 [Melastoma candidum]